MATTITRESMTDNVTVWNVTRIGSAIYDRIDTILGAALTLGGVVTFEAFGTHAFTSGGTGGNILRVRNTTSGAANFASLQLGNDAATATGALVGLSSAYTTASGYVADGVVLEATRSGGLSIIASNAAGDLRFYAGGYTERMTIADTGAISLIGATTHQLAPILAPNATALTAPGGVVTLPGTQGYIELTAANFVDIDIVGMGSGVAGKMIVVSNVDSGRNYNIYHEAAGATAADRFFLPNDTDITLGYGEAVTFVYSATISRWVACLG